MIWGAVATQWNIGLAMREDVKEFDGSSRSVLESTPKKKQFMSVLRHNVKTTGMNFAIIAGTFNCVKSVSQLLRNNKQDWRNSWAAGLVSGAVLITRIRGPANSIHSLASLAGFSLWTSVLAGGLHWVYLDIPQQNKRRDAKSFPDLRWSDR